ncbi:hypothetical protein PAXRUDRAFT_165044, partial [Paxillus rubicundulus Ve08.2h10]
VVNGNFSAQHMKMKLQEDDVSLSDGLAYMVESSAYADHIFRAVEAKDVTKVNYSTMPPR